MHYARQVVRKIDEAQRVLADFESNGAGVLRIGAGGAACHYLLPSILKELRGDYPKVDLQVVSGPTQTTVERLLEGELDLGLLTLPVVHTRLRVLPLGRDELVAIVAPGHAWSARKRVQPEEFAEQPLLIYERRSQTFRLIERVLLEVGVFPQVSMEMDHLEAVTAMVRDGLGVAIVPLWTIRDEVSSGQLLALSIGKSGLTRSWGLGVVEQDHQPHAMKTFIRLCSERLPAILSGESLSANREVQPPPPCRAARTRFDTCLTPSPRMRVGIFIARRPRHGMTRARPTHGGVFQRCNLHHVNAGRTTACRPTEAKSSPFPSRGW